MFSREFERVFVLLASPVMVAAIEEVNVVASASCVRLRMKSYSLPSSINFHSLVYNFFRREREGGTLKNPVRFSHSTSPSI